MVTQYPAKIDTTITLPKAIDNVTPVQGKVFNDLRDAIIAIEEELGVKPSGIYGTVRTRLDILEAMGGGGGGGVQLGQDLGGTIIAPLVIGLQGHPISATAPSLNQVLTWNGSAWAPTAAAGGSQTLAQTLALGNTTDSNNIVITAASTITSDINGQVLNIIASDGSTADGGRINIFAGNSNASGFTGGIMVLKSGTSTVSGNGGEFDITAGDGANAGIGGSLTLSSGNGGATGGGGSISINSGLGGLGSTGGTIFINAGGANFGSDGQGAVAEFDGGADQNGGSIVLTAGNSSSIGTITGSISLFGGGCNAGPGGNINLSPGLGTPNGQVFLNGDTTVNGKLTVTGLIDPTGLVLDQQATVPFTPAVSTKGTLWVRNDSPNVLVFTNGAGTDTVLGATSSQNLSQTLSFGNFTGGFNIVVTSGDSIKGSVGAGAVGATVPIIGGQGDTGFAGGPVTITGGPGSSTVGAGGGVTITGGTPTSGNGGAISISGSNGVGGTNAGGNVSITAGNSVSSGTAGVISITGGTGGSTSTGGSVTITGGAGGSTSGAGGNITIQGGLPTSGNGGSVTLAGRNAIGGNNFGGGVTITGGNATGSGVANSISITGGSGGTTGTAANVNITSGAGGSTSGDSGSVNLIAGTPTDGNGGAITLTAAAGVGTSRSGGNISLTAGTATGAGSGGNVSLTAGNGVSAGNAGNVTVNAGNGGTSSIAGSVTITSGNGGSTSGDSGAINLTVGTVTSGNGGSITLTAGDANDFSSALNGGNIVLHPGVKFGAGNTGVVQITGSGAAIRFDQVSAVPTNPGSSKATIWVKNTTPTILAFTDGYNIDNIISPFEITPTTLTTDQNDYNPTDWANATTIRLNSGSTAVNITGLLALTGTLYKRFINVGSAIITFPHENTSSSAANRIHNQASANFILNPDQVATAYYDTTIQRWRFTLVPATGGLTFVSTTSSGTDSSGTHVSIGTLSATITRNLPATPNTGDVIEYKAPSNAIDFNITISGNGKTIDGSSTFVLNANYMAIKLTYNGTGWEIS